MADMLPHDLLGFFAIPFLKGLNQKPMFSQGSLHANG
jgi:hypothetical protein